MCEPSPLRVLPVDYWPVAPILGFCWPVANAIDKELDVEKTYILSQSLGRGHELSDEEFENFVEGRHQSFTKARLAEIAFILTTFDWLMEVETWRREKLNQAIN